MLPSSAVLMGAALLLASGALFIAAAWQAGRRHGARGIAGVWAISIALVAVLFHLGFPAAVGAAAEAGRGLTMQDVRAMSGGAWAAALSVGAIVLRRLSRGARTRLPPRSAAATFAAMVGAYALFVTMYTVLAATRLAAAR